MNTIRRHATAKRWAPSASLLLATAFLLLALSPAGAHAAATLGAAHGDAAFLLLREMQCAAQNESGAIALPQLASDDEIARDENAAALASTREFQKAALKQCRASQTFSTLCFAPHNARDLAPQIETRATASRDLAPHLSHRLTAVSAHAIFAAAPRFAPRVLPVSQREYSRHFHSAAYRSGVRSNSFPQ